MFEKSFSNLANDLAQKLPAAANKFGNKSVEGYYVEMFNLYPKNELFKWFRPDNISSFKKLWHKAARIDDLSGRFLKDGTDTYL